MNDKQADSFLGQIQADQVFECRPKPARPKRTVNYTPTKPAKKSSVAKAEHVKSKKGGYRPVLVSRESLACEASALQGQMELLRSLHSARTVSDQDLCVLYILMYLNHRYPDEFLENVNPVLSGKELRTGGHPLVDSSAEMSRFLTLANPRFDDKLAKSKSKTLFELINNFNLHSVPHSARFAIAHWYLGTEFNIVLMVDAIPTSLEVLGLQAADSRCASLITDKLDELILGERDPLSFLLHDLVHAYKMFSDGALRAGQCGFSRAMLKIFADARGADLVGELCAADAEFKEALDYLISDMNSHPKHLFYYFKAILVNCFKRKYGLTSETLNGPSLAEFQRTFDLFIELFGMSSDQKELARQMLMPVHNATLKGSHTLDLTLIHNYFIGLYNKI